MNILEAAKICGLALQPIGQVYRAFCPFHKDRKTPNFIIYPETNSYFCFSCLEGGNVIRFLKKLGYKGNLTELIFKMKKNQDITNSDFRITASKKIAELAYSLFKKYPNHTGKLMSILEEIDGRLLANDTLYYKDSLALFKKFQCVYNELMKQSECGEYARANQ